MPLIHTNKIVTLKPLIIAPSWQKIGLVKRLLQQPGHSRNKQSSMTNNNYLKRDRVFLLFSILAFFSLVSCQKQPALTFGSGFVADNSSANIGVIDTSTVNLQTVYVDSTSTAGTGYLQVGTYNDPAFGVISSQAFIQVGLPSSLPAISVNERYDSIGLIMFYKKGAPYYGDTTQANTIVVNQVSSLYQLNDFQYGFFSNSSFPLDPTPLGQTDVVIAPSIPHTSQGTGDTVKIRLDDNLGQTLFNMAYNNSDTLKNSAVWLRWFHGLCLSPGAIHGNGIMYGLQDSLVMRVYYHQGADEAIAKTMDFGITNKAYQFNHVVADRSNPALPISHVKGPTQIVQTPPGTISDSTGHMAYIQTATGLNVKVTFPYLFTVPSRQDFISVLRATLTVRLVPGSWTTTWSLPPQLGIYYTDLNNEIGSPVPSSTSGTAQTGSLALDYVQVNNSYYTYDVTAFIKAEINNTDPSIAKPGLMLSVPATNNVNSFARAQLADFSYPVSERVQLKIYYISLYPHN